MSTLATLVQTLSRALTTARAGSPDVARTAQLMREANRLEAASPAAAAALRMRAHELVLA